MSRFRGWSVVALAAVGALALVIRVSRAGDSSSMLVHNVFFTLKDRTPEAKSALVASCTKFLTNHSGAIFYAAGTVADLDRPVNDRDFDVALTIVFKDRAAHDAYQTAPRHLEFIEANKATWAKVRVFDSDSTASNVQEGR